MKKFVDFDVIEVPLKGKNLVEASAGTGKTFSIAILVLRLILEKDFNIKSILLVTYTRNAVAELDERIRLFIRMAKTYLCNGNEINGQIKSIVDSAVASFGKQIALSRLNDSILFLDETSIMTIHGFSNKTLSFLAFETGQAFDTELVPDINEILNIEVNKFWGDSIIQLPISILRALNQQKFSRSTICNVVKNHLGGKRYYCYTRNNNYKNEDTSIRRVEDIKNLQELHLNHFADYIQKNRDALIQTFDSNKNTKKFNELLDSPEELLIQLGCKITNIYFQKFPEPLQDHVRNYLDNQLQETDAVEDLIDNIYCHAIQKILNEIATRSASEGIMTYDTLIRNLHRALEGPNREKIIKSLRQEYKAVFIDEFQDTDKLQYDIFMQAFGESIMFLIGDPKQSIYAFRQADINTYFRAYDDADHLYSMNTNFRSSEKMIRAMNHFFLPEKDFDTFYFKNQARAIRYFEVKSPKENSKKILLKNKEAPAMTILVKSKKDEVFAEAARYILDLLTNPDYKINTPEGSRNITASDIGVLVRNNDYGTDLQAALGNLRIPSIFSSKEKIMQSGQAIELLYVLKAMHDPVIENINAAVINQFTGLQSDDARKLDEEKLLELFRNYKLKWETEGIYSAVASYVSDLGVMDHLRSEGTPNGLRTITNLNHLTELIARAAYHSQLNQAELLNWYKRNLQLDLLDANEGELRLESDANAVTIMTIHKSKGLQFNIVIAIQMDFLNKTRPGLKTLYENGEYIAIPEKAMNTLQKSLAEEQTEQENRRVMYVAVTRAVYKAVLFRNTYFKNTGLSSILDVLQTNENIEIIMPDDELKYSDTTRYKSPDAGVGKPAILTHPFHLNDAHWRQMSYSSLGAKQYVLPFAKTETTRPQAGYDNFIFSELRKGEITGNMIHEIFEKIEFSDNTNHPLVIEYAINRYASSKKEVYLQYLPQLTEHVLQACIPGVFRNFRLRDVLPEKKITEMEFDFAVNGSSVSELSNYLATEHIPIQLKHLPVLKGMMKGFVDLFFEVENKYYLLDWKTNFLGTSLEDYNAESLKSAMEVNNYHLQYLIYILAAKKYLQNRVKHFSYDDFGGVIYCFIRGMRKDSSNGIYCYLPPESMISKLDNLFSGAIQKVNS